MLGAHSARRDTNLRRDVQEAFDRIWPDGIVEMPFDPDESYCFELQPKLSRAFRHIRNTGLLYEREADGACLVGRSPMLDAFVFREPVREGHVFLTCQTW